MNKILIWVPITSDSAWLTMPARSPNGPSNLWLHLSGLTANWQDLSASDANNSDWKDISGPLAINVQSGDTVLAAQAVVSLASAQRETNSAFEFAQTDHWGMAVDGVRPFIGSFDGGGAMSLPVSMRFMGRCFPQALAYSIDLLVVRAALLPETPRPYGERPAAHLPLVHARPTLDPNRSFPHRAETGRARPTAVQYPTYPAGAAPYVVDPALKWSRPDKPDSDAVRSPSDVAAVERKRRSDAKPDASPQKRRRT
jgi:hypothetical protein